jgi:cytochrome c553
MAAGKAIYDHGIAAQDIPACGRCHGDQAQGGVDGVTPVPRLAGQHRRYLEGQLSAFASNARDNKTMHHNAMNLTKEQIPELAAFLAAQ